jgi:hypothetical protein
VKITPDTIPPFPMFSALDYTLQTGEYLITGQRQKQVNAPVWNQSTMLVLLQANATTTVRETVSEGVVNVAGSVVLVAGLLLVVAWVAYLYR